MSTQINCQGSLVALVTPMKASGAVDLEAFKALIEWHINAGTQGFIILGTTGEAPTITFSEREQLIRSALEVAQGRCPIIVGTGTNATALTQELSKHAQRLGADACMAVTPYYNKPSQTGLVAHFQQIADTIDIPLIIYNVPGRTAVDISNDSLYRLAQHPNIAGVKDASSNIERVSWLREHCGDNFLLYSGEDSSACEFMLAGGNGVVSVTTNVAPQTMQQMAQAAIQFQHDQAHTLNSQLKDLHTSLFSEANPIPVKWALQQMQKINSGIRLPLTPLAQNYHSFVLNALYKVGITL